MKLIIVWSGAVLHLTLYLITIFIFLRNGVLAGIADYGTVAKGSNPTLYEAGIDPIVQLDEVSFNQTIFCTEQDDQCIQQRSYVVEFYSDWCGHCRGYAPIYKALAKDIRGWSTVVKIAAINCADPLNEVTCRSNGIMYYPLIKYFSRESSSFDHGVKLNTYQTVADMRNQITRVLVEDYKLNYFSNWPNFDFLKNVSSYEELWDGLQENVNYLAIIFESDLESIIGAQLLLDFHKYADRLVTRRALKDHLFVSRLHLTDFPSVVIFKRNIKEPIFISELRRLLFADIENYLVSDANRLLSSANHRNHSDASAAEIVEARCQTNPEVCQRLYYASESDMLKAMRYALLREVTRTGQPIVGSNLTTLRNFVDLLATIKLEASRRARSVFRHLRDFLDNKGLDEEVTIEEWQNEFNKSENENDRPFPDGDWEHCKGSSPQFRGYTCGLWTTFHTLTVSAYNSLNGDLISHPIAILHSIRDWVGTFFGCEHCRNHFLKMTTRIAKIETRVRKNEDLYLYLWRAHNLVNYRLKNRETEDPDFPKFQFPAPFLCPECRNNKRSNETDTAKHWPNSEKFDEPTVKTFLLKYYSSIKPITKQ